MSIFGSAPKKSGSERERNKSGYGRAYDCSQLRRKGFQSDNKYNQKCQRRCNRLGYSARKDIVPHHFQAARNRSADAVQREARHGAKNNRERGSHLGLKMQTMVKQPNCGDRKDSHNRGLRDPKNHGDSKEGTAARVVPDRLRARDKCDDRVVETENADLAENVSGRPGNGEYAERRWPEHPRDEKCEDAAEIRRQHRDGVQEGAAF